MRRGLTAFLALVVAALVGLASGCGGGGDSPTTRTVAGHTITVPATSTPAPSTTTPPTGSTTTVPSTITLPSGVRIQTSALAPFRSCLRRHGVKPAPLDGSGSFSSGGLTPQRIAQLRAQIRARVACAPLLPAPLRGAFERYVRQQQERRQRG